MEKNYIPVAYIRDGESGRYYECIIGYRLFAIEEITATNKEYIKVMETAREKYANIIEIVFRSLY